MSTITAPITIWSERGKSWTTDPNHLHRLMYGERGGLTISWDHEYLYTPEFIAFVESEIDWTSEDQWIKPPREHSEGIGMGTIPCPNCKGLEKPRDRYFTVVGRDTGVKGLLGKRCVCWITRGYWRNWNKSIDEQYRSVRFDSLAPLDARHVKLSLERQTQIISGVKANPDASYLLYGKSGGGKTHISVALHDYHLRKWAPISGTGYRIYCPIMRAGVGELLNQHHAWKMRGDNDNVPRPSIDVARIRDIVSQGDKPVLILDELDKLGGKPSEFKLETLLDLINRTFAAKGVVIATSNREPDWFTETWGEALGTPIIRRITEEQNTMVVRFEERAA